MTMQSLSKVLVNIRPWRTGDAEFVISVRNHPDLMKWFKQDEPLTLMQQEHFMRGVAPEKNYLGYIIELSNCIPIGVCSLVLDVNKNYVAEAAEFGIALLPEYQGHGYAKEAMKLLCDLAFMQYKVKTVYSDVFVTNTALPFYLFKCGFKATGVTERAYYKKELGWVDVVKIERSL